jgi:hypothetical protein
MSIPSRDSEVLSWTTNFGSIVSGSPGTYGILDSSILAFVAKTEAFRSALQLADDPGTRTRVTVAAKNLAKRELVQDARLLVSVVDGQPNVTADQKLALGIKVRKSHRTPVPPPAQAPDLDLLGVTGRSVRLRAHNAETVSSRRKPSGVLGLTVLSHVGDTVPERLDDWKFEASTTKTVFEVDFPVSLPPGTKVWVTAFWFNRRAESGPAAEPVSTLLQFGAPQLKLAGDSLEQAA